MKYKVGDRVKNSLAIPYDRVETIVKVYPNGSVSIQQDQRFYPETTPYIYDKKQQKKFLRLLTPLEELL